jgi:hypothetical protein
VSAANSAAQVSTVLNTGRSPSRCRSVRTPSSPASSGRSAAICRSDSPARLARRSAASSITGAATIAARSSTSAATWPTNQGSIPEAAATSATVAPSRSARSTVYSRPSCGRPSLASSESRVAPGGSASVQNPAAFVSTERIALPSASVKLRPSAIASPTDFIVVVSSGSAPGNFSNANRGIFTTT